MKRFLLLLALLFFSVERAEATRYWADSAGSDANACAAVDGEADPATYRTISGAVACATVSGDEVYIKAGTYSSGAAVQITNPTSGITIRGESATKANWPVLQPTSLPVASGLLRFNNATRSNVTMKYVKWDLSLVTASSCFSASSDAFVTNLTIEDFECKGADGTGGIFAADTASAMAPGANTSATIRRGKIYNWISADGSPGAHCFYWASSNSVIERNECTNVNGYGIQLFGSGANPSNNTIRYNYWHGFTLRGAFFIQAISTNNLIHNNIITDWFNRAVTFNGNTTRFINNTIYEASSVTGIFISGCAATCRIANNLINTAGTAISGSDADITLSTNITTGTAADLMIDAVNGNFSLKESSAAIDAGTVITGFSEGRYVGAGVDQGALEAPIRSGAVVEDLTDTIYRISFDMPTQSTRDNTGLQTCTVGNIALTEDTGGGDVGKTENSCSTSAQASRVDVTVSAAYTALSTVKDAYTRSTLPTLMDNVAIGDPNGTHGTNFFNAIVRTYAATAGTNSVDGGALPALTQTRYRFHFLNGTEASPTNHAAENTSVTLPRGAAFRLRIKFKTDDDPAATTFVLRYSKDAGAYTAIPDTVGADLISWYGTTGASDIPSTGTATTELLTSDEATNVACAVVRTSSDYPTLDFNNGETECEYVLQISNSVSIGTTYDFRVYKSDGTALDTYTVTPRVTVGSYVMGSGA